jgi:methyltransferase (TIGR00027 family)
VWEVDQPANIKSKEDRIRQEFGKPSENVTPVSLHFDQQTLAPALASRGYTEHKRTFFIWEAVTQYLTETSFDATLDFLATAPHGSRLAFTYVLKDFLDGQNLYGQARLHERYVKGNIWLFGLDPRNVSDFLDPYGWRITDLLGSDDLVERYVKPAGRSGSSTRRSYSARRDAPSLCSR